MHMKKIKINVMALVALAVAGVTGATLTSAGVAKSNTQSQTYYYNSTETNEGEFAQPSNWSTSDSSNECQSDGDRPCHIEVPTGQTINQVLANKSNDEVLEMSTDRKP
ncbi:hypothetical protein IQ31_04937 [Sphingobacterium siyangense]|uniref:Uncharacterized protein n=2 Tax=Sphingobacterium siyangense TaxID=459529 RepID=A0A562M6U0_9SPHI|nr:hypothetical protein IQ31_04937 [Sphingobacterium siyangense]